MPLGVIHDLLVITMQECPYDDGDGFPGIFRLFREFQGALKDPHVNDSLERPFGCQFQPHFGKP